MSTAVFQHCRYLVSTWKL